jgi:hypothetical protein
MDRRAGGYMENPVQLLTTIASIVGPLLVALLVWSLKRNIQDQDNKLAAIATDVRQLSSTVGNHATSLAAGAQRFQDLSDKVKGLEDRERARSCFGVCKLHGDGG